MAKKKSSPPKRKRNREQTQAAICQAALECFTSNGADRTTILEIAKRAKVPTSLIHYYFESQDALFAKVFELVLGRIRDFVTPPTIDLGLPADQALITYVRAHFEWARLRPEEFAIWMYFYYASAISKRQRELNTRVRMAGRERVGQLIQAGVRQGIFQLRGATPERLALEVQVLVTGAWVMGGTENPLHDSVLYAAVEARILDCLGVTLGQ